MEKSIQEWEHVEDKDPTGNYGCQWIRHLRDDLEFLRLERSIYGDTFLHMAGAAVAASIISIADQGIRLSSRAGPAPKAVLERLPAPRADLVRLPQ